MNEVRLLKFNSRQYAKHMGSKGSCSSEPDFAKKLKFKLSKKGYCKVTMCQAQSRHIEKLCKNYLPLSSGRCQYQEVSGYGWECRKRRGHVKPDWELGKGIRQQLPRKEYVPNKK